MKIKAANAHSKNILIKSGKHHNFNDLCYLMNQRLMKAIDMIGSLHDINMARAVVTAHTLNFFATHVKEEIPLHRNSSSNSNRGQGTSEGSEESIPSDSTLSSELYDSLIHAACYNTEGNRLRTLTREFIHEK